MCCSGCFLVPGLQVEWRKGGKGWTSGSSWLGLAAVLGIVPQYLPVILSETTLCPQSSVLAGLRCRGSVSPTRQQQSCILTTIPGSLSNCWRTFPGSWWAAVSVCLHHFVRCLNVHPQSQALITLGCFPPCWDAGNLPFCSCSGDCESLARPPCASVGLI